MEIRKYLRPFPNASISHNGEVAKNEFQRQSKAIFKGT